MRASYLFLTRIWLLFGLMYLSLVGAETMKTSHKMILSRRQSSSSSSSSITDILNSLKTANLTKLANLLESNPTVLQKATSSPGLKTFLAPTDSALPFLNWVNVTEALLYHILNGSVPIDQLSRLPQHTVLHSILQSENVVNLPGGNGQAVALSTGTKTFPNYQNYTPQVNEAINSDYFIVKNGGKVESISVGDLTILPINRVLTVPGNVTFTAGMIENSKGFANLLSSLPNEIDQIQGLTVFLPTQKAFSNFTSQNKGLSQQTLQAILQNHLVINRAVYSPLLIGQGSMVTGSGQDLRVQQINQTDGETYSLQVKVGNQTANVLQTDIIHRTGVIHLIDQVLFDTNFDQQRANQAAQSAKQSQISGISGPISNQNSASSQGANVPASPQGSSPPFNANSTISSSGNGSGSNSNSSSNAMSTSHNSAYLNKSSNNMMMIVLLSTIIISIIL